MLPLSRYSVFGVIPLVAVTLVAVPFSAFSRYSVTLVAVFGVYLAFSGVFFWRFSVILAFSALRFRFFFLVLIRCLFGVSAAFFGVFEANI